MLGFGRLRFHEVDFVYQGAFISPSTPTYVLIAKYLWMRVIIYYFLRMLILLSNTLLINHKLTEPMMR
jgi:hypothetical protein